MSTLDKRHFLGFGPEYGAPGLNVGPFLNCCNLPIYGCLCAPSTMSNMGYPTGTTNAYEPLLQVEFVLVGMPSSVVYSPGTQLGLTSFRKWMATSGIPSAPDATAIATAKVASGGRASWSM
jgi:hypothetical protein